MQKLIRKYLLPCLFFGNLQLMAQVQPLPGAYPSGAPVSYVRTWDATAPEQDANLIISRPLEDVKMTTQYLDGLGRPLQLVVKQGSKVTGAAATDVVSSNVYDAFGREPVKYLPYADAGTNGAFKLNPFNPQVGFYNTQLNGQAGETTVNNTTPNWAYSQTNYEGSLLNRVTESFAPGNSWAGTASQTLEANRRSVKNKYWLNTTLDAVKIFTVTNGSTGSFGTYSAVGNYDANVLFKNITVDERGKQVVEFKDKEGRVILKKVQIGTVQDLGGGTAVTADWLSTYYIYDNLGLLRCVVQPEGVKALTGNGYTFTTPILEEQCFRYLYDERNRMVMKKVPGAGYVGMVYDARDRLVITQDANMRSGAVPRFAYTKYDDLNRPVETGIFEWTATIEGYWGLAYNQTDFPWNHWGPIIPQVLTSTWYDDYNFPWGPFANAAYLTTWNSHLLPASGSWPYPQANSKSTATKGLVTGTRTLILGTGTYIYDVTIYDAKGRVIQVQSTNISSNAAAMDVSTMQYSWAGQPLVTVHSNALTMGGIVPDQTAVVVTQNSYDELGRVTRIEKKQSHTNVNSGAMSSYKTIAEMEYDALGQLKKKKLAPAYNSNTGLEHLAYDYNIRGWMLGMNRWYARDASLPANTPSGSGYFGFDLGYDKTANNLINSQSYDAAQYNGNISGTVWKSRGDGEKRLYNYSYDNANRLLQADFKQYNGSSFINDPVVNYDVKMGDGSSPASAYDANGNILQMQHWGLLLNSSAQIDDLRYKYEEVSGVQSNRLKTVVDVLNDPATKLGDFRTATTHPQSGTKNLTNIATITDYTYDANGNMVRDYNKAIGNSSNDGIVYNHLNLPSVVTVRNAAGGVKGTITYTYTASGQKLQKITEEKNVEVNPGVYSDVTTNTLYMPAGIVYESKLYSNGALSAQQKWGILQFMGQEEGRIRFKPAEGATAASFEYDYMIKDHLGNVRMVLTEEQQQKTYPAATFENATVNGSNARAEEINYYDIDQSKIVGNPAGTATYPNNNGNPPYNTNPYSNTTATTGYMYKTNASTNKTGLGIVLKVMAGDNVNIYGVSYHKKPTGGSYTTPVSSLSVSDIINAFVGTGIMSSKGISGSTITGASGFPTNIASLIGSQPAQTADLPRASINWIVLDEQFRHVAGGFDMANGTSGSLKFHTISTIPTIPITKNGYIYVYVSNESNYDVLFDNLQVIHTPGPILEETHYYPFGLTMSGISSKAAGSLRNKYKFGGKELQSNEFSDNSGLELYDFHARMYDQQTGHFPNPDPLSEKFSSWSPYVYSYNNPVRFGDPTGMSGKDWVEKKNGDIYWDENATSQETTKEGETYRGKTYQRDKIWVNVNVRGNVENGVMRESYNENRRMSYENLTPWVDQAFEEMAKNISETGSNPEITKYWDYTQFTAEAASGNSASAKEAQYVRKGDATPWCAAFINYNLERSGIEGTNSAVAFSFKTYGQNLGNAKPVYGSIAVMQYSHVGIVVGANADGRIILLGGNQGDAVNLSPNSKSDVIKYVYPAGYIPTNLNLPSFNLKGRSLTTATSR